MGEIKKVIVLGASGDVGREVVKALLQAAFDVTIALRPQAPSSSGANLPRQVHSVTMDYESSVSLEQAFSGQDAIVEAFNPAVAVHQERIVRAAVATGVQHILTPDFSSDTFNPNVAELMMFEPKLKAQNALEAISKGSSLHWTAVITGPFFDWAIPLGIFWLDPRLKQVTVIGSGNQRVSMSSIDIVGRATVAVLSNPQGYLDRPAYFADYTLSSNDLLSLLNEGQGSSQWKATRIPLDGWFDTAAQKWHEDTRNGIEDRLHTDAYQMMGTYGLFSEPDRYGGNFEAKVEKGFGVEKEEFERMLNEAIAARLAKDSVLG
ncbi:hypothetical protein PT974_01542 [Cladobotryum mycophilum]|uniref:NmrA-like domain-containing protein n=1 Tax=Cladobotryum mycophilum TaxID=491253 RepID=A0ABR0T3X0_9HYPO